VAPAAESRLEARMRSTPPPKPWQPAAWGLRAIARELGADRKTGRRFAHATSDEAVARAISRPTVLDRTSLTCTAGGPRAAAAPPSCTPRSPPSVTAAACAPSTGTCSRSAVAQPPAALTPPSLKIGEVTSWLLRRADDLSPRQQQLLADVRSHCAQLDRLAEHVTSFAKR
jgi:hypothetical protein